jgi:hypothetical protein
MIVQSFYNLPRDACVFFVPIIVIVVFLIIGLKQKLNTAPSGQQPWAWWCLCLGLLSSIVCFLAAGYDLYGSVIHYDGISLVNRTVFIGPMFRSVLPAVLGIVAGVIIGPSGRKRA